MTGVIDLVERNGLGCLRITDHKTGSRTNIKPNAVVNHGQTLQPILYALAAEKLFPDTMVEGGRLYFCTSNAGYKDHFVGLKDESRESATHVVATVGEALNAGFLPAAPEDGACRLCNFLTVCGPNEVRRVKRKPTRSTSAARTSFHLGASSSPLRTMVPPRPTAHRWAARPGSSLPSTARRSTTPATPR